MEEGDEWRDGFFGAITTSCMRPICTLNQMKNEVIACAGAHIPVLRLVPNPIVTAVTCSPGSSLHNGRPSACRSRAAFPGDRRIASRGPWKRRRTGFLLTRRSGRSSSGNRSAGAHSPWYGWHWQWRSESAL